MIDGPVDWEMLKKGFLERLFPLEYREKKMVKFMNLHQGEMCVKE